MSVTTREQIYGALFALSANLTWGAQKSFAYRSRRVKTFSDVPEWPALCQAEHDEQVVARTNMPAIRTFGAVWLVYHNVGKDASAIPASESNAILDQLDTLFPSDPSDPRYPQQTLGGLVHRCAIQGRIIKEHGDIDGQALLIVPIRIFAP